MEPDRAALYAQSLEFEAMEKDEVESKQLLKHELVTDLEEVAQKQLKESRQIDRRAAARLRDTSDVGLHQGIDADVSTFTGSAGHLPLDSTSMNSVEEQTAMFEDILHPEIVEALDNLEQLDFEESELIKQMKNIVVKRSRKPVSRDFLEALLMELELRRKEKVQLMQTFRRVEEERNENTLALIKEAKSLRQQSRATLEAMDRFNRRQEGNVTMSDYLDVYDWVVDIGLLEDLAKGGWCVQFSEKFFRHMMESGSLDNCMSASPEDENVTSGGVHWTGAVIAVVGLYDKGKTFVLNQITQSNLPSGKKVSTKGLSFKHVSVDRTSFVLLDSAGSYSPVKVENELSVAQKEATELFLSDLIFDLSDYFICVVNDFTSLDQRFLDKLTRGLQQSNKMFREVIVVHNLKDVSSAQVLAHVWETQVTQIYQGGSRMSTQVAAINPDTGKLEEKHVEWFKTNYSRHICLANHDSEVGRAVNPWTISLLRYWLKSVFVPVDRKFSVVNAVIHYSNRKLSSYFKKQIRLHLDADSQNERVKHIKPLNIDMVQSDGGEFRLPQVALDASGLMLTRPDAFVPPVDVIIDKGEYTVYMDVPGLSASDITLSRHNVTSVIKGTRTIPYTQSQAIEKQERKYGDFTMTFRIPDTFERKWSFCHVESGVLCMKFKPDRDDSETLQNGVALGKAVVEEEKELEEKDPIDVVGNVGIRYLAGRRNNTSKVELESIIEGSEVEASPFKLTPGLSPP